MPPVRSSLAPDERLRVQETESLSLSPAAGDWWPDDRPAAIGAVAGRR